MNTPSLVCPSCQSVVADGVSCPSCAAKYGSQPAIPAPVVAPVPAEPVHDTMFATVETHDSLLTFTRRIADGGHHASKATAKCAWDLLVGLGFEQESDSPRSSEREEVEILKRCAMWLGKMIADGAHLNSTLPNDCVRTLERTEDYIRRNS